MNPSTTVQLQHCRPYKIHKAMNDYSDESSSSDGEESSRCMTTAGGCISCNNGHIPAAGAKEALRVPACDDTATAKAHEFMRRLQYKPYPPTPLAGAAPVLSREVASREVGILPLPGHYPHLAGIS